MRVSYSARAEKEFLEIVKYYESDRPGLGEEFIEELDRQIEHCLDSPELGVKISANLRRLVMKRFPYNIIYQIREHDIRVIAVAHQHRKPGYWLSPNGNIREPESAYQANIN